MKYRIMEIGGQGPHGNDDIRRRQPVAVVAKRFPDQTFYP